jgi:hypothetical protein
VLKTPLIVGLTAGAAIAAWNLFTMMWPVSYGVWNGGRSVLFIGFAAALIVLAAFVAQSGASVFRTFGSVAGACVAAASLPIGSYIVSTRFFAHRIVQLPEYMRDYTYHGYTSPETYLAAHYSELLSLQFLSWSISAAGLLLIAGASGWCLGQFAWGRKSAVPGGSSHV